MTIEEKKIILDEFINITGIGLGRDVEIHRYDWDLEEALDSLEARPSSTKSTTVKKSGKSSGPEKNVFKVGDKVICIDDKKERGGKVMEDDCVEFLKTFSYFTVREVTPKLNIDIGHRLAKNGNVFYFSPNRFKLKDGITQTTRTINDKPKEEEPVAKKSKDEDAVQGFKEWKKKRDEEHDEWKKKQEELKSKEELKQKKEYDYIGRPIPSQEDLEKIEFKPFPKIKRGRPKKEIIYDLYGNPIIRDAYDDGIVIEPKKRGRPKKVNPEQPENIPEDNPR